MKGPLDWRLLVLTTLGLWAAITFVLGCGDPVQCRATCQPHDVIVADCTNGNGCKCECAK